MKDYKGYSAKVVLDDDEGVFHGEVVGITDVVTFQGQTADELTTAFHDSVDDYLAFCEQRGEKADKPYSGRFVLRLSPELHRQVALVANKAGMSMNEWIVAHIEECLEGKAVPCGCPQEHCDRCGIESPIRLGQGVGRNGRFSQENRRLRHFYRPLLANPPLSRK